MTEPSPASISPSGQIEFYVRLSETHRYFCDLRKLNAYSDARRKASGRTRRARLRASDGRTHESQQSIDAGKYRRASEILAADRISRFRNGTLLAAGYRVNANGRDPHAVRELVPRDVLQNRGTEFNWDEEWISGNGLKFVDVHVGLPSELPDFARQLIGLTLWEGYQCLIQADPALFERMEDAFCRYPDWTFDPRFQDRFGISYLSPRFEDWPAPEEELKAEQRFVPALWQLNGEPEPEPPGPILHVRRRLEEILKRLIRWLRSGVLHAEGTLPPEKDELVRARTPSDWWAQPSAAFCLESSCLWTEGSNGWKLLFSDIRFVDPPEITTEAVSELEVALPAPPDVKASTLGGGERAVYLFLKDWEEREPRFREGRKAPWIANQLAMTSEFARYKPETLETYVRRALKALDE